MVRYNEQNCLIVSKAHEQCHGYSNAGDANGRC